MRHLSLHDREVAGARRLIRGHERFRLPKFESEVEQPAGCRLVVAPGAVHAINFDAPGPLARIIQAFMPAGDDSSKEW